MATINYKGLPFCWDRFLIEGKELFEYMKNNFDDMFENDFKIKHFNIRDEVVYDLGSEECMLLYGTEIQKELVPWIKKEFEDNRLFDNTLWKPFRDRYVLTEMYLGYKKLFKFKQYYFQLCISSCCELEICSNCINKENRKHFEIIIYGIKNEQTGKIDPYDIYSIESSNFMPKYYWEIM